MNTQGFLRDFHVHMHVCYLVQQNIALKGFFAQSLSQGSTADGKSHIKVAGFQSGAEGCHL